jgi:hypothetical protein
MTDTEEEFYLPKLIQAIPKYQPLPPKKKKKQRHVCLLFLTIDDLPLEHLWKAFFSSNDDDTDLMISVICHAKFPEKVASPWLKQRMLVHKPALRDLSQYKERYGNNSHIQDSCLPPARYFSRKPEWGSVEITRAMIDLVDEGLRMGTNRDNTVSNSIKDPQQAEEYRKRYSSHRYIATNHDEIWKNPIPPVDRFIFVSETCMPVTTMSEFECALFHDEESDVDNSRNGKRLSNSTSEGTTNPNAYDSSGANKSWINARNTPNNGYARQLQWDATDTAIPRSKIWKADQWIVLTRHHAWPILSLIDDAIQSVQQTQNSDSGRGQFGGNRSRLQLALWQCFRRVKASDEIYFPTVMALLGILDDAANDDGNEDNSGKISNEPAAKAMNEEVCRRRVTYCDWSMNAKNPASFLISRKDNFKELIRVMRLAREERCLFARKFNTGTRQDIEENEGEAAITGEEWEGILRKLRRKA